MTTFAHNISPSGSRPAPRDMRTVSGPTLSAAGAQVEAEVTRLAINLSAVCKHGLTVADYSVFPLTRLRELDALRQASITANTVDAYDGYDPNDPMKPTTREVALNRLKPATKTWLGYDLNTLASEADDGEMLRLASTVRTAVAGASPETLIGLGREVLESLKRKLEG